MYPTYLDVGKLYGTVKVHKLPELEIVGQLPILPVVSITDNASYHYAKYLAKILLSQVKMNTVSTILKILSILFTRRRYYLIISSYHLTLHQFLHMFS